MSAKSKKIKKTIDAKIISAQDWLDNLRFHFQNEIWLDRAILFLQHFRTGSQSDEPVKVSMYDIKGLTVYEIKTIVDRLNNACKIKVITILENTTEVVIWDGEEVNTFAPVYTSPKIINEDKAIFNSIFGYSKTVADLVISDLYYIRRENGSKQRVTIRNDGSLNIELSVLQKYPEIALSDTDKSNLWSLTGYNLNEPIPIGENISVFYLLIRNVLEYSSVKQKVEAVLAYTNTDRGKKIIKTEKGSDVDREMKKLIETRVNDFNKKLKSFNGGNQIISFKQDKNDRESIILTLL